MSTATEYLDEIRVRFGIESSDIVRWGAVVGVELAVVWGYFLVTQTSVTEPRYVVYPFVWINLGALAMSRTRPSARRFGVRAPAAAITGMYLFVLLTLGGLLQLGLFQPLGSGMEFRISWVTPGWGPIIIFRNALVQTVVVPFKLIGYFSIAYLLYARLLDATKGALSGVFGLVSCVGCSFSLLVPLLGASTFSTIAWLSWDLSTLVFVVTVGMLYWSDELGAKLTRWVPAGDG